MVLKVPRTFEFNPGDTPILVSEDMSCMANWIRKYIHTHIHTLIKLDESNSKNCIAFFGIYSVVGGTVQRL
jgi:hypothetical protein